MYSEETVRTPAEVICFSGLGGRRKRHKRTLAADERFASLGGKKQIGVLCHVIGYMEASRDLIASGRQARPDEVSRIFGVMEELINESWKGGMI